MMNHYNANINLAIHFNASIPSIARIGNLCLVHLHGNDFIFFYKYEVKQVISNANVGFLSTNGIKVTKQGLLKLCNYEFIKYYRPAYRK